VHWVPEETANAEDVPPDYASAARDQPPGYWPETIHAPHMPSVAGEMVVDGLPTGSVLSFLWSFVVSMSFQWVGFLLTYILHTNHAGRYGSRAGLGITLIQTGYYIHRRREEMKESVDDVGPTKRWRPSASTPVALQLNGTSGMDNGSIMAQDDMQTLPMFGEAFSEWISFFFMTLGWFVLLISVLGYWRVKRWERALLRGTQTTIPGQSTIRNRTWNPLGPQGLSLAMLRTGLGMRAEQGTDEEQVMAAFHMPESEADGISPPPPLTDEERELRDRLRAAGLA